MKNTIKEKRHYVGANVTKEQKKALATLKSRTGKTYAALVRSALKQVYHI